ncbi:MAG: hypothetical protein Q9160_006873 [Pyrenula sp. 1 TL-2023]
MANTWLDEYLRALEARDIVEKANFELYEASDRAANLQAIQALTVAKDPETASPTPPPPLVSRTWSGRQQSSTPPPSEALNSLRSDLAIAQQSRLDLSSRLEVTSKELATLKVQSKRDNKRISQLTAEVSHLTVRLRDRDEELKGKTKLLDDVQDENATLHMQLDVSDENHKKLRAENQELVDRWMQRMKGEADKMNEGSRFS